MVFTQLQRAHSKMTGSTVSLNLAKTSASPGVALLSSLVSRMFSLHLARYRSYS